MIEYAQYKNYDEYKKHQASKLHKIIERKKLGIFPSKFSKNVANYMKFLNKYAIHLDPESRILCMAARTGFEVQAFRNLGFNAIGIDLNPGPWQDKDDPLVIEGDFNHVPFDNQSFDAIHFNSIDHAFRVELVVQEAFRLLKPGGKFVVEVPHLYMSWEDRRNLVSSEKFESCSYQSIDDINSLIKNIGFSLLHVVEIKSRRVITLIFCREGD